MKVFHYLFEQHSGVVDAVREGTSVHFEVPDVAGTCFHAPVVDPRDQRILVVFDGELLWESAPKGADIIRRLRLGVLETSADHLRIARFGSPAYVVEERDGKKLARQKLYRNFLLTPCGNFVFRRVRDRRSLGPMYVFAEVKRVNGEPRVTWRNSSY